MSTHEFGIMNQPPQKTKIYEVFEPEKYNCISISDENILTIVDKLDCIDCFWHSLSNPQKGLSYTGITLIPIEAFDHFLSIVSNNSAFKELESLIIKAKETNSYIIHFGI